MASRREWNRLLTVSTLLAVLIAAAPGVVAKKRADPGTRFYVPRPSHAARVQIAGLVASGNQSDAALIRTMIRTPQAYWVKKTLPRRVREEVRTEVARASQGKHSRVPVFVAYNLPFRDCAAFAAGGAETVDEYHAWIEAVAAGIGNAEAWVILEPDSLGIIPWYDPFGSVDGSNVLEWCQPAEAEPATAAADRFAMLNYAVDVLTALPNVRVYLDATHSAWLGVGDAAERLVKAGIERADGFYLNVSNYQFTANLVEYGTWISSCIAYATGVNPGDFYGCPNQYWNGGPLPAKIAELLGEWTGVALSPYAEWSGDSETPALNTSGIDLRYANMLGGATPGTHFVLDTGRNGVGPWQPPSGVYPDPQDWCNPPDRGLGLRPTTNTGNPLVDAYLWVRTPGESDGVCTRGLGPAGETVDPEWGIVDPSFGRWFPAMALDLVHHASPPLSQ